ncbi:MAG TPA: ABC transporter ATP-binding protein [Thermotogota bacterium]|nr:ABC transporter ATP-binding protein [Thermotogota bacterium]HPJ89612.1 ABC transporter ATP-binding protein [Thermotogota bacterium]HPR96795.1 ABC transporter ATP-binding protein [Thermotogota bacterium]
MPNTILKVDNLKKHYPTVKAVDGISFEISKGTVFTLLGPNGAGKTTTLEIIEGIKNSDDGEIEFFGEKMKHVTRDAKERMGVSLQSTNFIPHLKVREVFELFASLFKKNLPVDEVIGFVSLEEKKNDLVEKLSGGQKQRVAIGCALINDPDMIFLDEPTTGLDPQARRNIWDIVNHLKKEGKTIFLTTHYMEEAQELSDVVCIMDHGKIIAMGTPAEHIKRLGERNYIEFKAKLIPEEIRELNSWDVEEVEVEDDNVIIPTKELHSILEKLLSWANEKGMSLNDISIRQPNLEDVFLSLTGRRLRD